MRLSTPLTLLALAGQSFAALPVGASVSAEMLELTYRPSRDWKIELPAETYRKVSGELPGGFVTRVDGGKLLVDCDGDGTPEREVEGKLDDQKVRRAMVVCRNSDGRTLAYRLMFADVGWLFAPGGMAVGKLGRVKLSIIDQDGDGRFDGYGTDALIVGTGNRAHFLSKVISVGGSLYSIDVAPDGTHLSYEPYEGESGVLDLTTAHKAQAKLLSAIVVSEDGSYSFDLAGAPDGLRVPAGTYRLRGGRLGLGKTRVEVRADKTEPLRVEPGKRLNVHWGGPVRAEFAYQRRGSKVAFSPDKVWYYGAAGEEYLDWKPIGKSPEFTVRDKESGKELAKAVFAGST